MGQSLLFLLKDSFNDNEIYDLGFELNIEIEDLPVPNQAGRADRIRALIQYCQKNGRMADLITLCSQLRPAREWPDPALLGSNAELLGEPVKLLHFEPETVAIPTGPFRMGSDAPDAPASETPMHVVDLPYFRMGKYPVTNEQYVEFLKQNPQQQPPPAGTGWFGKTPPQDKLDHPVVGITWEEALAFCQWLSAATQRNYRLPSEAEWEKAARGQDARPFPWGTEWTAEACTMGGKSTTAVSAHEAYPSPHGCIDMLGNASEWTTTLWGENRHEPSFPYPYNAQDGREDLTANQQNSRLRRICRGGSFNSSLAELRVTLRESMRPTSRKDNIGFRVLLAP